MLHAHPAHPASAPSGKISATVTDTAVSSTDVFDYEALPPSAGPAAHMAAGALAGIAEHCLMYPLDLIKTRMQILSPTPLYAGVPQALRAIASTEGAVALWRGLPAIFIGAGPAHAVYFGAYEATKSLLLGRRAHSAQGNKEDNMSSSFSLFVSAAAGCSASLVHEAVMNPFDVVKQRMQADTGASAYRSLRDCAATVWRREGLRAFFVSYPASVATSLPFHALHVAAYEQLSHAMNPTNAYSPAVHLVAGGIAGSAAAALTTPLDAVKTLLQTKGDAADAAVRAVRGVRDAARLIYTRYGAAGFFRGIKPRVLTNMPATAVCWCTYEYFKSLLRAIGDSQSTSISAG